jgi:hypothetical protein
VVAVQAGGDPFTTENLGKRGFDFTEYIVVHAGSVTDSRLRKTIYDFFLEGLCITKPAIGGDSRSKKGPQKLPRCVREFAESCCGESQVGFVPGGRKI